MLILMQNLSKLKKVINNISVKEECKCFMIKNKEDLFIKSLIKVGNKSKYKTITLVLHYLKMDKLHLIGL